MRAAAGFPLDAPLWHHLKQGLRCTQPPGTSAEAPKTCDCASVPALAFVRSASTYHMVKGWVRALISSSTSTLDVLQVEVENSACRFRQILNAML
jgi:hypothetical protein